MPNCERCNKIIDEECECHRIRCPYCHFRDFDFRFKVTEDRTAYGGECDIQCPKCDKIFDDLDPSVYC